MKIDDLIFLARAVGDYILPYTRTRVMLEHKELGGDISRFIDAKAEDGLFYFLDIIDQKPDVITEAQGYVARGGEGILVVDPVDGSVNADKGLPFFAVSIAYFENLNFDSLKSAVIYEPVRKITFYAERGKGSFIRKEDGTVEKLGIPKKPSLESIYFSISGNTLSQMRRLINVGIRIRELGSVALGMAFTAAGMLDAFVDVRGFVRLIDISAGYLILKEAGYAVDLKMTESFPYPRFSIIAAPRELISALKVYLGSITYRNKSQQERRGRGD